MNGKGELARHRLWSFSLIFLSFNDVSEQLRKVARDQQAGNHDRERRAQWSTLGALSRSYYSYTIPREMEREGKKRSKVPNNIFFIYDASTCSRMAQYRDYYTRSESKGWESVVC